MAAAGIGDERTWHLSSLTSPSNLQRGAIDAVMEMQGLVPSGAWCRAAAVRLPWPPATTHVELSGHLTDCHCTRGCSQTSWEQGEGCQERGGFGVCTSTPARPPAHPPPVLHTVLHNSRYLHPPPPSAVGSQHPICGLRQAGWTSAGPLRSSLFTRADRQQ